MSGPPPTPLPSGSVRPRAGDWLGNDDALELLELLDPERHAEAGGLLIGGGLVVLGLLGFVIRSSAGAAIDGTPASAHPVSITEELKNASDLHAAGAITDEEFGAVKKRLLA